MVHFHIIADGLKHGKVSLRCKKRCQSAVPWREEGTDDPVTDRVHGQLSKSSQILGPKTQNQSFNTLICAADPIRDFIDDGWMDGCQPELSHLVFVQKLKSVIETQEVGCRD